MPDLTRRLTRLEARRKPAPGPARWVIARTPEEVEAAEAAQQPGEFLVIWRVVDPEHVRRR